MTRRTLTTTATTAGRHHLVASAATAFAAVVLVTAATTPPRIAHSHCQVPCGIFDDPAVVREIHQCVRTIREAMVRTQALTSQVTGRDEPAALNQAVRWITVKEEHASRIIRLVTEYCLCQRVKPSLFATEGEYRRALATHHAVLLAAVKAKQSVSEADCDALMEAAEEMARMYTK